jgi:hypothetical protein
MADRELGPAGILLLVADIIAIAVCTVTRVLALIMLHLIWRRWPPPAIPDA